MNLTAADCTVLKLALRMPRFPTHVGGGYVAIWSWQHSRPKFEWALPVAAERSKIRHLHTKRLIRYQRYHRAAPQSVDWMLIVSLPSIVGCFSSMEQTLALCWPLF
jgi:hypothetical protein